jgi:UDP-N-acetyl-D-glucosamine dehydrogenase
MYREKGRVMGVSLDRFRKQIALRQARVAVVGLGYVGLPLAMAFFRKGFTVLGIEKDRERLARLKKGESYITDVACRELRGALARGRLIPHSDFSALKNADAVIICVPTPLKRKYHPDISFIKEAVKQISRNLRKGSLVVLESTTFPGTTDEVILPILESGGLRHGEDFHLCFSPERIDPGNAKYPVWRIPKVIGGASPEAALMAKALYDIVVDKVVLVSSARVAEITKLLENTFRIVNIGLIDEMAMMAHRMNIDIWEVIRAASTKPFGFMPFYPGPGVGGHCIPKDPLYLYWKAKKFGFKSRFIKLASDVISSMPEYVVRRVEAELKKAGGSLKASKVLVCGVTYKKDVKDLRKSPGLDIIDILQRDNVKVAYYDPFIPYLKFPHLSLNSVFLSPKALNNFDCVIIATDHSKVDYGLILKNSRLIFDARNVYKGKQDRKVVRL